MNFGRTSITGVHVVEIELRTDERGLFAEAYNAKAFAEGGLPMRVDQMNVSVSAKKGTVRGMHWQADPFGQVKLVRCVKGRAFDVLVDVRKESSTYGRHFGIEITPSKAVYVPKGIAHGWQALEDGSEIQYLVEGFWSKEHERGLRPDDPHVKIPWPVPPAFVSERDRTWPLFEQ